ncbi:TIGR02450 family Trp-rich protein [Methylomonas sp. LW13]|uniref:TIGR02450 family Trp-rich protein n=1 Tax=Methylomonas aurea TaxID=2952224 RepID=A0ABT1UFN7_9GAMM|nr:MULTISPECIES: TIGR02450 family Trp-rich protein [unclassified Methylomonas]MCQ8181042.1 TIGR02450 family Trp-rich protein [Methylomonas sp. SURF-1]QBC25987.1 TIGR02450 family Trp-rich protein [Methylomonas sp. LW13]
MPDSTTRRLNPNKLLLSKWTAAKPQSKEKHFLVTQLIKPELTDAPVEHIELEAIYSRRSFILPWRDLTDTGQWLQGWQ